MSENDIQIISLMQNKIHGSRPLTTNQNILIAIAEDDTSKLLDLRKEVSDE